MPLKAAKASVFRVGYMRRISGLRSLKI